MSQETITISENWLFAPYDINLSSGINYHNGNRLPHNQNKLGNQLPLMESVTINCDEPKYVFLLMGINYHIMGIDSYLY